MQKAKPSSHLFFADILRAISIFAVIILHTASDYVDQYGEISSSAWWSANIYNGLVRFCVPMFVLLSGALLLQPGKIVTAKEIFYKRLPRILIPLAFWSIVYVLFDNYINHKTVGEINVAQQLKVFYQGPVVFHLWYLYMLTGIYLMYPVINIFISVATEKQLRYFLIVWFGANAIIGIINILFALDIGIDLNFFTGYIGYFILGYYLLNFNFTAIQLRNAYLLCLAGLVVSIITPFICVLLHFTNFTPLVESDFTPDIFFTVTGLFLFMKNKIVTGVKSSFVTDIFMAVSKLSFGIYLIHILVMRIVFSEKNLYFDKIQALHPAGLIPLKAIIILILSFTIIKLIRLVPYLKKVAG